MLNYWILLAIVIPFTRAANEWDCHVSIPPHTFDLTSLAGEHTDSKERSLPPSTMVDSVRFNLCKELTKQEGVADADQCPSDTFACFTQTSKKEGDTKGGRVVSVVPLATKAQLDQKFELLKSPEGLRIVLHGPSYPPSSQPPALQSLNLTLLCSQQESGPKFIAYEGGHANVEWSTKAACTSQNQQPPPSQPDNGNKDQSTGSGIGWFFLVLLLSFIAYFLVGAYHNFTTYGASGWDLVPHRDFWRDVPYLLRDVVSHLCSSGRSGGSRGGGYVSV